jgi:ribosomal protein S18 acetylase RimI-like enzyme
METASAADADQVVTLWERCGLTRPWNDPRADFSRALAGATSTVLIARDGETVTASVMVGDDGHRGWVYYLAVAPDRRGRGLGRAAMAAAEAWLRMHGAPKVQIMVRDGNEAATAFYRALGYEAQPVAVFGRFLD